MHANALIILHITDYGVHVQALVRLLTNLDFLQLSDYGLHVNMLIRLLTESDYYYCSYQIIRILFLNILEDFYWSNHLEIKKSGNKIREQLPDLHYCMKVIMNTMIQL